MNKDLKQKWIDALRSGKYKQGTGMLLDGDHYCCLGVLADVMGLEISPDGGEIIINGEECGYSPFCEVLPDRDTNIFWGMNDLDKKTFNEIADYIEEHV